MMTVVFAGLPNTGKSTWITHLTRTYAHTGNYSGVTVESQEACLVWKEKKIRCIDLPGIHSLNLATNEEKAAKQILDTEHIDVVVQVINSTQIKASLPLLLELRELQIPMIGLLNFKEDAQKNDIHIDCDNLTKRLGFPVVQFSVFEDSDQLLDLMVYQSNQNAIYRPLLNPVEDRIFEKYAQIHPMRKAIELFYFHHPELDQQQKSRVIETCMKSVSGSLNKSWKKTLSVDRFLLVNPIGKLCLLIGMMISFSLVLLTGLWISGIVSYLVDVLCSCVQLFIPGLLQSFMSDVLFSALGTLAGFIPLYGLLTLYLAIVEESGIMARLCVLMENIMRCFHLNGRVFISMVLAHGCAVPSIVHAASLDDERMRRKAVLLLPLCSCSAKIPVYLYFANAFVGTKALYWVIVLMFLGMLCMLMISELFEFIFPLKQNEASIVELPVYRRCHLYLLMPKMTHQLIQYVKKCTGPLLSVFVVIWRLMNYPSFENSFLKTVSTALGPCFEPLGFGQNWIYVASLLPAIVAKEAVIGTFSLLMNAHQINMISSVSVNFIYVVFVSLTVPCVMTLNMIKEKMGVSVMIQSIGFSLFVSYIVSLLLVQFIMFF